MAIQTERPGGGDDRIAIFRAKSAEEARKARAALEAVNIPVDLPDQAIDAIYAANPAAEMAVKVALKHSAKAIQAISAAIPPPAPPSEIATSDDRQAAAEKALAPLEAAKPAAPTDRLPPSAVDKEARRAAVLAVGSTFFPPLGLVAAFMAFTTLGEMNARPDEVFYGKQNAKVAAALGLLIGICGTATVVLLFGKRNHYF